MTERRCDFNIFYLSHDPTLAARWHCDQHINKMPIELCQMLVTARILNGELTIEQVSMIAENLSASHSRPTLFEQLTYDEEFKTHYTPRMRNHPCAVWVKECWYGMQYTELLLRELGEEYTRRYHRRHKSVTFYDSLPQRPLATHRRRKLPVPLAVKDHARYPDNPVRTYREFYIKDKARFAKWAHTPPPPWWPHEVI